MNPSTSEIDPHDLESEAFVGFSDVPPILRGVVDDYLRRNDVSLEPSHHIDNLAMGISLVVLMRGTALLPAYVEPLLPWSIVSGPLSGQPPTIDLTVGYRQDNPSFVLCTFLSNIDELIAAGPAGQGMKAE